MAQAQTNPPAKAGGFLLMIGLLVAVAGLAMLATVALAPFGIIAIVVGLVIAGLSFLGGKAAPKEPGA